MFESEQDPYLQEDTNNEDEQAEEDSQEEQDEEEEENQYKIDQFVEENITDYIDKVGPGMKEKLKSELRQNLAQNQLWISKRMGNNTQMQPQYFDMSVAPHLQTVHSL